MAIPEDPPMGVPEWVVTFGDMMSLLLTFFIMLVSMSELKSESRVAQAVQALQQRFGRDARPQPGAVRLRGAKIEAPRGDKPVVTGVRPGRNTMLGGRVMFAEDSAEVTDEARETIATLLPQLVGRPQKIEVRGHTSRKPLPAGGPFSDHYALAYARAHAVMQLLLDAGLEPHRLRLSVAAGHEPTLVGPGPEVSRANSRVEVFLLDEVPRDYKAETSVESAVIVPSPP